MVSSEFLDEIAGLPGLDAEAFCRAIAEPPAVSVKLNRRKAAGITEIGYGELEPVKWCGSGYYLDSRPNFTLNPLLHAGVFYVQDASSMIYETVVDSLVGAGALPARAAVLDMCAAPGGKTTSMINALPDGSLVVANEFVPQRASVLKENLLKWGYPDMIVTNSATSGFAALGQSFHLVAVDAPCSGEGMMRKDAKAVEQWSPALVHRCASLQRDILSDAVQCLLPGGYMIYSTCTFNRLENEDQLLWLRDRSGMEIVDSEVAPDAGILGSVCPEAPAMRFMPHATRGEGLFVALLRKPGSLSSDYDAKLPGLIAKKTKVILDGIPKSVTKGKVEVPASESVLAATHDPSRFPVAEVDLDTALRYLRHEAVILDGRVPRGYVAVSYKGHTLGLVKNIGSRANNLYPSAWRIRMQDR